jgi:hypothetical protein
MPFKVKQVFHKLIKLYAKPVEKSLLPETNASDAIGDQGAVCARSYINSVVIGLKKHQVKILLRGGIP